MNIAKLFNDHILFQEYTPFKFVFFIYIWTIKFHFHPKKPEKIKSNSDQRTVKMIKVLRKASLGLNFTGSYKKMSVVADTASPGIKIKHGIFRLTLNTFVISTEVPRNRQNPKRNYMACRCPYREFSVSGELVEFLIFFQEKSN